MKGKDAFYQSRTIVLESSVTPMLLYEFINLF